jgi:hypothetical protein
MSASIEIVWRLNRDINCNNKVVFKLIGVSAYFRVFLCNEGVVFLITFLQV